LVAFTVLDVVTAFAAAQAVGASGELSPFVSVFGLEQGLLINLISGIVLAGFAVWAEWTPVVDWLIRARLFATAANLTYAAGLGFWNLIFVLLPFMDAFVMLAVMNVRRENLPTDAFLT
jgi:hypothetical protein